MFTPAPLTLFLLIILAVILGLVWLFLTSFPSRKRYTLTFIGLWLLLTGAVPFIFHGFGIGPQFQFPMFAAVLAASIGLAVSQAGYNMIALHGLAVVVAFQMFRAPLEYVLVVWNDASFMPIQMTWNGDNFDVITGLLALPAALMIWCGLYPRLVAAIFNLIGVFFLGRIVLIVGLSSPTPLRSIVGGYETGPEVLVGMSFPGIWIGTIAVAGAFFLHFASLGYLVRTRNKGQGAPTGLA